MIIIFANKRHAIEGKYSQKKNITQQNVAKYHFEEKIRILKIDQH